MNIHIDICRHHFPEALHSPREASSAQQAKEKSGGAGPLELCYAMLSVHAYMYACLLCYAMLWGWLPELCYAGLRYAMLCYAMLCYVGRWVGAHYRGMEKLCLCKT